MGRRTMIQSIVLVVAVFVVLLAVGTVITSGPSSATQESARPPTTTTTTEPPPEGVVVVKLSNGVFRPSNLAIDLDEIQVVQWINEDDREYIIVGSGDTFESPPLNEGDTFEFDFSTLDPAIHRYNAVIGFQRIPGSVDTRPEQ
ncbi:MAG: hypothetical protein ACR2N9_04445 [Acidimicrobiia bacterium]